ncbi:hypothetical protein [Nocardioides aromaticivorans]|uniref:hypothetical protein n=1 Tax=Nocardioides aromaticivorans TaxID=200618 RepID=UPI001A8D0C19|nr:hypothetical protein [Nocardioides aromaticivorans]
MGPLDVVEVAALEHGARAVAQVHQHGLDHPAMRDTRALGQAAEDRARQVRAAEAGARQLTEGGRDIVTREVLDHQVDHRMLDADTGWLGASPQASGQARDPAERHARRNADRAAAFDGNGDGRRTAAGDR